MTSQNQAEQYGRLLAMQPIVQQQEFILTGEALTLGRAPLCDIVVRSESVSRVHARIERHQLRYVLYDEGSANGTFVNNRRISSPHQLKDQDLIGLGSSAPLLRFLDPDPTFVPATRLRYDDRTLQFTIDGAPLPLPPAQFRLLLYLYHHSGDLCTREACAEAMWNRSYDESTDGDALDRAVYNLRRTLKQHLGDDLITTRRGMGYVFEE